MPNRMAEFEKRIQVKKKDEERFGEKRAGCVKSKCVGGRGRKSLIFSKQSL